MSSGTKLHEAFKNRLVSRDRKGSKRRLSIAAKKSVDFSSNDFLSLSHSPHLRAEFFRQLQKAKHVPLGSGGSRLLDGNSDYAELLERNIADFHNAPAGLLFNSGFDANSALFACVPQAGDVIIYDEYIHASVHEGMRLSRATACLPFAHNSLQSFADVLGSTLDKYIELRLGHRNLFVAVEAVYSMDGDVAPLKKIVETLSERLSYGNGHVIIDEAHSTGVFGEHGRGMVCELGLEGSILARLHTFGKALSSPGAIVLCSPVMREYLINYARSFIYTTAMGLPSLAMILSTYRLMRRGTTVEPQHKLWRLIAYFHENKRMLPATRDLQVSPDPPRSPIFSMRTTRPRELAGACQAHGFIVRPIVYPTVPKGAERVRVCLHAANTKEEIDKLLSTVKSWMETADGAELCTQPLRPRL